MKKLCAMILCLFLFFSPALPTWAAQTPAVKKTVRVGYFPFAGFNEIDSNGEYSGYGYDYLMEIAKYTDWNYQFVEASFSDCLEMLEKGELDIIGSVQYTPERAAYLSYPRFHSGVSYGALFVNADDQDANYGDYKYLDGKIVGMLEINSRNQQFFDFMKQQSFSMLPKYYEQPEDLEMALQSNEVDAIATSNLRKTYNEKIVLKYDESFFYFAVANTRQDLLDELNSALSDIEISSPNLQKQLNDKYYSSNAENYIPVFSTQEREFLKASPPIKLGVYYHDCSMPTFYKYGNDYKGVSYNILNLIAAKSGLDFEVVQCSNWTTAKKAIINGDIDMIADMHFPFEEPLLQFSQPYFRIPWAVLGKEGGAITTDSVLCVSDPFNQGVPTILESYYPNNEILTTKTFDDALSLARSEPDHFAVENLFSLESKLGRRENSELKVFLVVPTADNVGIGSIAFAFRENEDILLINSIDKCINSISTDELNGIMITNYVTTTYEQVKPLEIVILSATTVLALFILGFLLKKLVFILRNNHSLQYDGLTGLYTKKALLQKVIGDAPKLATAKQDVGVIFIDIDDFKNINDTFGHISGDRVIAEVGKIIKTIIGKNGYGGRFGGDEFLLFISAIESKEQLSELSSQILEKVRELPLFAENSFTVTVSIGGYVGNFSTESFEDMQEKADALLYQSKNDGKNRIEIS